jgi:hypothetical protein
MRIQLLLFFFAFPTIISAQLSGNYTINSAQATGGTNFQTFSDLAGDLTADGVSGNVIITVVPGSGPYHEQVTIANIPGSGPSATVTLEGSGETLSAFATTTDRHVLRLTDCQYFTINNLHIKRDTTSTGGFYGIHIFSSGDHITISNCSVDISGTTSTLYGAYVASGSLTSILDSGNFHNINFISNEAAGGGYGVSLFGKLSNLATNIVITGNTLYDFHSNGIYLRETNGVVVSNNYLNKRTSNISSCNAIQLAQAANINGNIFNNYITVEQTNNGTMNFRGIYLFNGTGHKVYNNVITDIRLASGDVTGIEIRTGGTAPEISFNTISIDNTSPSGSELFGIKEELSNTNAILRNNLISITQNTSAIKGGLVLASNSSTTTALNSNYNLIWVPGGNAAIKNSTNPVLYATLGDWQTASTQDANSISLDPMFATTAIPIPTNPLADNLGTPVAGITTDITGVVRSNTPDIGAYEFPANVNTPELTAVKSALFPNPFTNELNVVVAVKDPVYIFLFDETGKLIFEKNFSEKVIIPTETLPPGIYFYELKNRGEVISKGKLIRQQF